MNKLVLLVVISLVTLTILELAAADFLFQRYYPKSKKEMSQQKLTCRPGRTLIMTKSAKALKGAGRNFEYVVDNNAEDYNEKNRPFRNRDNDEYDEEENDIAAPERRNHMTYSKSGSSSETCEICVCAANGQSSWCSKRPAANINECLYIANIESQNAERVPYKHISMLSLRVRRQGADYIWHRDEIPYDPKAKCYRGTSYYSNSPDANDTDIDVASDVESILGYNNRSICFYCVCSVSGSDVGCILRDPYFCDYYRFLSRDGDSMRDVYTDMFGQDRPSYFRLLSYRVRRTMDQGIYDLIDYGGDTLCCNHPNGHRKALHTVVRSRVWQNMRRKIPKENLLAADRFDGGDYADFIVNND